MNLHEIHKLELHETYEIGNGLEVTRVPGGWIYHRGDYASMCFVPFSNNIVGQR